MIGWMFIAAIVGFVVGFIACALLVVGYVEEPDVDRFGMRWDKIDYGFDRATEVPRET